MEEREPALPWLRASLPPHQEARLQGGQVFTRFLDLLFSV